MQQELHDPVLQLKHINEFRWSMLKLALLTESIDETTARLKCIYENYHFLLKNWRH